MPADKSKSREAKYIVLLTVLGLPTFFFLYCCSGLPWPMPDAKNRLADRLLKQVGLVLPESAAIQHAARIAQNDPSEYYEIAIPSPDMQSFVDSILAKDREGASRIAESSWTLGPTPSWWKVPSPGSTRKLKVTSGDRTQGFVILFTPGSPTLFMCWYDT